MTGEPTTAAPVVQQTQEAFSEYLQPNAERLEELFTRGIVAFDTNVLLLGLKLSRAFYDALMGTLCSIGKQVWLPHQVVLEFSRNARPTINETERSALAIRDELLHVLDNHTHPRADLVQLRRHIQTFFQDHCVPDGFSAVQEDLAERFDAISDFMSGRFGVAFTEEQLANIRKEGSARYAAERPPGFKDAKKPTADRAYGDLILWRQLLDRAKATALPAIFVTADYKEDWWWRVSGKTLGPRPELRSEFKVFVGEEFYMYSIDQFLRHSFRRHHGRACPSSLLAELGKHRTLEASESARATAEAFSSNETTRCA